MKLEPASATNDTVLDRPGAFDATTLGPTSAASARLPLDASLRSTVRSTVLPRVEVTGETSTVVSTSRPRFEPRRALGEGGLGEVTAAHDHDIGREVAIKRLRKEVDGPAAVARFVDEIRTVGALEHPNIVGIHDVGMNEDGSLYFVMPCVRGETIESIITKLAAGDAEAHAHWTFERRIHVFRQLLDAVAFAHKRGFVHRDIKPANVMVGSFGEVFLMDWGIAKPLGAPDRPAPVGVPAPGSRATATGVGAVIGTPAYMSPEQAAGEPVDVRSDVYSLCVLLHEFLGLRHYLEDCKTVDDMILGVVTTPAPKLAFQPNRHQPPPPAELGWFVDKGLAKSPGDRYQTVDEMIARLEARDEGVFPIQCPITFTNRVTREFLRFVNRHPNVFMGMVMMALVGSIALAVRRML